MGWNERRQAQLEARDLRTELELSPGDRVNPFAAAEQLGIAVVFLPFGKDHTVEGALMRHAGKTFMLVNSSKRGRRARFTCTHELGHHRLLDPALDISLVDTVDDLDASNKQRDDREREADVFAAEFLMPEHGVLDVIAGTEDPEDAAGELVRRFDVSPVSAAIRLAEVKAFEPSVATELIATITSDWKRFWREQQLPKDLPLGGQTRLPDSFMRRAERLFDAGVISPERHDEIVNRPLQPGQE